MLDVFQPQLQTNHRVASLFRFQHKEIFASSALMNAMSKVFIAAISNHANGGQIPLVKFVKEQQGRYRPRESITLREVQRNRRYG